MRLLTEEVTFCPTPSKFDPSDVPSVHSSFCDNRAYKTNRRKLFIMMLLSGRIGFFKSLFLLKSHAIYVKIKQLFGFKRISKK